jgi:hypothetical protein
VAVDGEADEMKKERRASFEARRLLIEEQAGIRLRGAMPGQMPVSRLA